MDHLIHSDDPLIFESEKEKASNAYVMTLVGAMAGLPLPIVNLVACLLYWFFVKTESRFVRYHIFQATAPQLLLVLINSVAFAWTLKIMFFGYTGSDKWVAYLAAIAMMNGLDYISNIRAAIAARQGKLYNMTLVGPVAYWKYIAPVREGADKRFPLGKLFLHTFILTVVFTGTYFIAEWFQIYSWWKNNIADF